MNVAALQAISPRATDQIPDHVGVKSAGGQPLSGKALRNASPADQRKEVAAQFEAILVRQLLGPTITSMLGKDGAASNVYGDMMTDTFAQQLTRGGGFGLSQMLQKQLTPRTARADLNSPADPAELL
jgi:Rod binding domain-containing protein